MNAGHVALITGATGFIGSRLAGALQSRGAEVHALVRSAVQRPLAGVHYHRYDGTRASIVDAVERARPSTCFHLATHFKATHSAADIDPMLESNVRFGTLLVDALTTSPSAREDVAFVNAGSAWQHRGGSAYAPTSLYAATKQAFEDVLEHYAANGLKRTTLTLFDTYGPGDARGKLLPLLLSHAGNQEPIDLTSGEQLMDLLYIDDAVDAFIAAPATATSDESGRRFSLATGAPLTVRQVVAAIERVTGTPLNVQWGARPYRRFEMFEPWDAGPRLPGWQPRVTLAEGIRRIMNSAIDPV